MAGKVLATFLCLICVTAPLTVTTAFAERIDSDAVSTRELLGTNQSVEMEALVASLSSDTSLSEQRESVRNSESLVMTEDFRDARSTGSSYGGLIAVGILGVSVVGLLCLYALLKDRSSRALRHDEE